MRDLKLWLEEAHEVMVQVEILEGILSENTMLKSSNVFLRGEIAKCVKDIKALELERKEKLKGALELHQERGNC